MNDQALNILGIAKKAGRVETGDEQVSAAARAHSARLIILASDASPHIVRKVRNLPGNSQVVQVPMTKEDLARMLGKSSCAAVAITDVRLARSFVEKLPDQEKYAEVLESLSRQAKRVDDRQAEKKAHQKNIRKGKRRTERSGHIDG